MPKRKTRHDAWHQRAAQSAIWDAFQEDVYELPAHERNAVLMAALSAAVEFDSWPAAKVAAVQALQECRAMDDGPVIAWADCTERFPDDARLRDAGWRVLRRPARGEATWVHACGREMLESQAVATLAKLAQFKAK
jgi:hypothetical protein